MSNPKRRLRSYSACSAGCHTQGDTLAEVMENAKEAIDLYLETLTVSEKKDLLKEKVVGIQKVDLKT